ncbi:MAG: AAA family ATPase [Gordonia sp. (in: high G+C Gram-positive bacteria)]
MSDLVPGARDLNADDLGIGVAAVAKVSHGSTAPDAVLLDADDPGVAEIARLRDLFGGVILTGPPGTSKSWLAGEAARLLTEGDDERQGFVQFHASYQFEDFMEGFRPKADGAGFEPREGVFLKLAREAKDDPEGKLRVLVIDELSRADVGRVFGEALTYVEKSKRNMPFALPSGDEISIPENLFIIATMNPLDRGVDDVDAAFERRFGKIEMLPDADVLEQRLVSNGAPDTLVKRLVAWFRAINGRAKKTPAASVGHAYFWSVVDEASLRDVWDYQLRYLVERAFKYDEATYREVVSGWNKIFADDAATGGDADEDS